jgi:hypothetical protein
VKTRSRSFVELANLAMGSSVARYFSRNVSYFERFLLASILLLSILLIPIDLAAQVPVALTPTPRIQFSDQNGTPLAGGCVFTYNAGTTTPAATYVDINGIVQNTNPIILDAAGRATIYLANQEYKISVFSSGGVNCASGAQQWVQDNVSAFQVVTGTQSITFAGVTSDPTGVAGLVDYRSDIPCFRSFTTVWDCFVRLADTQTLTNKTLTAPLITGGTLTTTSLNGVTISGVPTTGQIPTATSSTTATWQSRTIGIPFIIDGAGAVITTGSKGYILVPFNCTITGWTILADQSGSIVIEVGSGLYSNFPTANSIDTNGGTDRPTLVTQQNNQNLTLTKWFTAILANSFIQFTVNSATTVTRVTVQLNATVP